jgi:hypothetical protein
MKIRVGKYILRSDPYCMWIDEEYEQKNGKTAVKRVAGYSPTLTTLLKSFRQHKVLSSDAESLEELIEALRLVMTDMDELNKAAVENDFRRIRG